MKTKIFVFLVICLCVSAVPSFAQKQKPDPEIQKMLKEMGYKQPQQVALELQQSKILRAVYSERQLQ